MQARTSNLIFRISDLKFSGYHSEMPVNPDLLKILVCPLCKATLDVVHDGKGLKCTQCHRVYPIRDDIPVMLASEAKVEN